MHMTPSQLRANVDATGSHFFDFRTMRFFGDTMRNFGCSSKPIAVTLRDGSECKAYELWRRKPVKHGLSTSAYFCSSTFRQVFPVSL